MTNYLHQLPAGISSTVAFQGQYKLASKILQAGACPECVNDQVHVRAFLSGVPPTFLLQSQPPQPIRAEIPASSFHVYYS